MKKAILFTLICAIGLGLAGCGGGKADPFTSVVCAGGKTISLGMTQAQTDSALGEKGVVSSSDATGTTVAYAKSSVNVVFGTDAKKTATQISILSTDPTVKTGLGISMDMNRAAVKALVASDTTIAVQETPGVALMLSKTVGGKNYQIICTDMGGSSMLALMVTLAK